MIEGGTCMLGCALGVSCWEPCRRNRRSILKHACMVTPHCHIEACQNAQAAVSSNCGAAASASVKVSVAVTAVRACLPTAAG